jgi:hypothetical protein
MNGFPRFMQEIAKDPDFYQGADRLLNIKTPSAIGDSFESTLQTRFQYYLDRDIHLNAGNRIGGALQAEHARLATGVPIGVKTTGYRQFSVIGSLLAINERQNKLARQNPPAGKPIMIATDVVVERFEVEGTDPVHPTHARVLHTSRGPLTLRGGKTNVILAAGPIPNTTILLNSLNEVFGATLQAQVVALQARVVALQARVVALQARVAAPQAQVEELRTQVVALQAQVVALQARVAALQAQAAPQAQVAPQATVGALGTRLAELRGQLTALQVPVENPAGKRLAAHFRSTIKARFKPDVDWFMQAAGHVFDLPESHPVISACHVRGRDETNDNLQWHIQLHGAHVPENYNYDRGGGLSAEEKAQLSSRLFAGLAPDNGDTLTPEQMEGSEGYVMVCTLHFIHFEFPT